MERTDLEGFIYECGKDIKRIFCPLLGEILIDDSTRVVNKSARPGVGKWCKLNAQQKHEDGPWYARRVELMAYPRLKYVLQGDECIIEGTAVVCNVDDDSGYLWNDNIGYVSVHGEIVHQLNPLTAVKFHAIPQRQGNSAAYFTVKEICIGSDYVFQSDFLLFSRSAKVKEDGNIRVPDCTIQLLDSACSTKLVPGLEISILYYKQYNNPEMGVGIYATTDKNIIAGIREDFFTTERCNDESCEPIEEVFTDAKDDIALAISYSSSTENIVDNVPHDVIAEPSESIVEFVESDDNSKEGSPPVTRENTEHSPSVTNGYMNQVFDMALSYASPSSSTEAIPNGQCTSSHENKLNAIATGDSDLSDFSYSSQEELWDKEFIQHLKNKIKEKKNFRKQYSKISIGTDDLPSTSEDNKKKLMFEMNSIRILIEERLSSMHRTQSNDESAEAVQDSSSFLNSVAIDLNHYETMQNDQSANDVIAKTMDGSVENDHTEKAKNTADWIVKVDEFCAEVLSNSRLRNFVGANENGVNILRDMMKYLEHQITSFEVSTRLGIPISEITAECYDMVHEEQAVEICTQIAAMNGFENFYGHKVPDVPEQNGYAISKFND